MKLGNVVANAESKPKTVSQSDIAEQERSKSTPTPKQIRERAFEIHIERGGIHGCDLDDWLEAEREFREKYTKSNDEGPKKK
jgi:hypothetical protein